MTDSTEGAVGLTHSQWLKVYEDSGELPPASVLKKQFRTIDAEIAGLKAEAGQMMREAKNQQTHADTYERERDAAREALRAWDDAWKQFPALPIPPIPEWAKALKAASFKGRAVLREQPTDTAELEAP